MKKKMMILLIALTLVLVGCRPSPTAPTTREGIYPEYRIGIEGVRIAFAPNMPPQRLFDNEKFQAVIEVENTGTFPIGGAGDRVYISGFDPTIITGIPIGGQPIPQLEGRSQFVPQGGFDRVVFEGTLRSLRGKNIDKYPARILATACYGYKAIASAPICIDPEPFAPTTKQKVCFPAPTAFGGGQGADVGVVNVEVEPSPGRTRFKIEIQNMGRGDVFRPGGQLLQKCSPFTPPLEFDEIDYVLLEDVRLSGTSITPTCKPLDRGHIRLTNGRGSVHCEFATRGGDAYITPMTIVLSYGYRLAAFKDVEILPIY